jgi:hypothetical protein
MADHYGLEGRDRFVALASAWWLQTGHFPPVEPGAREAGAAAAAEKFLTEAGVDRETTAAVKNAILTTGWPSQPATLPERIVGDARLFYLAGDDFAGQNKLLRKEAEARRGAAIDKDEWRKQTIALMENHRYHTDYGRDVLEPKKLENLAALRRKDAEKHPKKAPPPSSETVEGSRDAVPSEAAPDKKKGGKTERGVETVFRTTSNKNQQLSAQADNKAHIMIQVNAIVISVLLNILLGDINRSMALMTPIIFLLVINVVTIIFAMLATRPTITDGRFNLEEVDTKKANLLFFGNYYRMSLDDYAGAMFKLIHDYDFLYGSLIRDTYYQGLVLGRKYRLLRFSYNVFMYGIAAAIVAFIAAFVGHQF